MIPKIVKWDIVSSALSNQGGKKVLVGGCFDLLHYGHLRFLQEARKLGDSLIVALESDDFIQNRKNRVPVHTQQQRAEILVELESVDSVILLPLITDGKGYSELVDAVMPSYIAITQGDPNKKYKEQHAQRVNAEVREVLPHVSSLSSSGIITYASLFSD